MPLPKPPRKRRYPFKRKLNRKLRRITFMLIAAAIASGINYYNTYKNNSTAIVAAEKHSKPAFSGSTQQQIIQEIRNASNNPDSQFWVSVQGKVIKLLKDDLKGSKHQKFLIKIAPDLTLLISHNIDLAPRVPIRKNDLISLRGRYEWNNRGGLIHWTHHDPKGKKKGGWIRLNNKDYR